MQFVINKLRSCGQAAKIDGGWVGALFIIIIAIVIMVIMVIVIITVRLAERVNFGGSQLSSAHQQVIALTKFALETMYCHGHHQ